MEDIGRPRLDRRKNAVLAAIEHLEISLKVLRGYTIERPEAREMAVLLQQISEQVAVATKPLEINIDPDWIREKAEAEEGYSIGAGIPSELLTTKMLRALTDNPTMDDLHGDRSDHPACPKCEFCIQCGDCDKYGCGRNEEEE